MPTDIINETFNIPYGWNKKTHFMMVKRVIASGDKFYIIRTKTGEYTLQFYGNAWHVISPVPNTFNKELLIVIGEAIYNSGI